MELIETIVLVVHVLVALALVALVLLQQGKGAEAGASFGGGASQTVFGSQGSGNFLTKMTTFLAILFFVTSFTLAIFAKQKSTVSGAAEFYGDMPVVEQPIESAPEATDPLRAPAEAIEFESGAEAPVTPEIE